MRIVLALAAFALCIEEAASLLFTVVSAIVAAAYGSLGLGSVLVLTGLTALHIIVIVVSGQVGFAILDMSPKTGMAFDSFFRVANRYLR